MGLRVDLLASAGRVFSPATCLCLVFYVTVGVREHGTKVGTSKDGGSAMAARWLLVFVLLLLLFLLFLLLLLW